MTVDERNAEISRGEVESFKIDKPARYFAYHAAKRSGLDPILRLHHGDKITTWTGDDLATVTDARQPFHSGLGDLRQNFRCKAINGETYSGTAYLSAGDYVRMRKVAG